MGKQRSFKTMSDDNRQDVYNRMTQKGLSYLDTDIPTFKPQSGENCIRIVPPLADDPLADGHPWGVPIIQYYIDGFGYAISPKLYGPAERDPVEEGIRELKKTAPEMLEGGDVAVSKRIVMYVLDLNTDPEQGELKIWSCPNGTAEDMVRAAKNKRTGAIHSLEDPDTGRPIFFEVTGSERTTKYVGMQLDDQPLPLDDEILDMLEYFEDIIKVEDDVTLEKAIRNVGGEAEERSGAARSRSASRRGRSQETDDAGDDDDAPPVRGRRGRVAPAEEDDAPPPRTRRGSRAAPPADDDTGEDDAPPARGRGSRRAAPAAEPEGGGKRFNRRGGRAAAPAGDEDDTGGDGDLKERVRQRLRGGTR